MFLVGGTKKQDIVSSGSTESQSAEIESHSKKQTHAWSLPAIQKLFPDLPAKVLCNLVELPTFKPYKVLAIVPDASSDQPVKFFDIGNETISTKDLDHSNVRVKETEKLGNGECKSKLVEPPTGDCRKILAKSKIFCVAQE